jgi:hypothetical protein
LVPAAADAGRLAVRELGRSLVGPRWEVRLEAVGDAASSLVAYVDGTVSAPIEAVAWNDDDVMDLDAPGVVS